MVSKRVTTSAIHGYSIAEVRRILNTIRSQDLNKVRIYKLVNISEKEDSLGGFCQKFVLGNHIKRLNKKNKKKKT